MSKPPVHIADGRSAGHLVNQAKCRGYSDAAAKEAVAKQAKAHHAKPHHPPHTKQTSHPHHGAPATPHGAGPAAGRGAGPVSGSAADAARARADTQTKIFELQQDVTVNKAKTADKAFNAMDGYIRQ